MPAQLNFKSTNDSTTIDEVLQRLRKLDGVLNIGKEDTAEGVAGIIIFENAELAAAARNRTDNADIFVLTDPALQKPAKERKQKKDKISQRKGATAVPAGDFFNGPSPSTLPATEGGFVKRGGADRPRSGANTKGGRGGRGRGGEEAPRGERAERGERRGGGTERRSGSRRPRTITAYVACVHNIPYGATNDMVFHAFKDCGHIIDIARAERLALLYMREPEMVTDTIIRMNGKPFMGITLAVCAGGEIKLPVPPPPPAPMPPMVDPAVAVPL